MGSTCKDFVVFDDVGATTFRLVLLFSAITLTPVKIENISAKKTVTGMTLYQVDLVKWFQGQTDADVSPINLYQGTATLEFSPKRLANSKTTNELVPRDDKDESTAQKNKAKAIGSKKVRHKETVFETTSKAGSAVIAFQTILPLLLMIGDHSKAKNKVGRDVVVRGWTNCPGAPSFEYLDQVFAPALKKYFGIQLECHLEKRGWGLSKISEGEMRVKFTALPLKTTIIPSKPAEQGEPDTVIQKIVATVIAPLGLHQVVHDTLRQQLDYHFGHVEDVRIDMGPNGSDKNQTYVILVAHSASSAWARDWITSDPQQPQLRLTDEFEALCTDLESEISGDTECVVDQFLQDQLVVYQAIAQGTSSLTRQKMAGGQADGEVDSEVVQQARNTAMRLLKISFGGGRCTGAGIVVGENVQIDVKNKQELHKQS